MNTLFKSCIIATSLLSPTFAFAVSSTDIQACMQKFAEYQFPDSRITYVTPEEPSVVVPLEFNKGTHDVAVTVADRSTGRVLATGTCAVTDAAGPAGHVVVAEVNSKQ